MILVAFTCDKHGYVYTAEKGSEECPYCLEEQNKEHTAGITSPQRRKERNSEKY